MRRLQTVDGRRPTARRASLAGLCAATLLAVGCETINPQYAVRPTPTPVESPDVRQIELTISAQQAAEMEKNGVQAVRAGERVYGFDLQRILQNVSRQTERPNLPYHVLVAPDKDPNAASLADGRVYITTGMLQYLASRGSNENELAFILGHELAHTVAQHLVKRYQQIQKEQVAMALVGLGTAVVTRGGGAQAQQIADLAKTAAQTVGNVIASGYSQDQELEADQLGIRYMIKAGYNPWAAVAMVEDFQRFDRPGIFLRTHPPTARRLEDLQRYLIDSGYPPPSGRQQGQPVSQQPAAVVTPPSRFENRSPTRYQPIPSRTARASAPSQTPSRPSSRNDERRQRLVEAQKLYPAGSQSWKNLQQQLDALDRR